MNERIQLKLLGKNDLKFKYKEYTADTLIIGIFDS